MILNKLVFTTYLNYICKLNILCMDIKPEEYQKLLFNVENIDEKTILITKFPLIKLYPELKELQPNIFKFIVLLFDMNTPLNAIDSYNKRVLEGALLSGFPIKTENSFEKEYQKIIEFKDPIVNKAIVRYCRIQKDVDYSELKIYEMAFHLELGNLMVDDDATKRAKIIENINSLKTQIKELQSIFFNRNNNTALEFDLMDIVENDELELRPEDIALKFFNGENPLNYDYYAK